MKTMKTAFILLLATTVAFSQNNDPQYATFKKTMETYQVSVDKNLKPAACKDYQLKYIVKAENFKETVFPINSYSLCDDLNKFDVSKNPTGNPGWTYDIKAIGDRYYAIRADYNNGGQVKQEFYYYERRK